ncbi:MAG TPA: phenylacetate--CoA ligase, partial [Actinobacteria bacterium]|nr:phenylacetate--CoA ligase [Actinomycetota bacterium]
MDTLEVRVEARPDFAAADERAKMVKQVKKRVKDVIGVSVGVDVVEPNGIERSIGKAKRVVDNRPK